MKTVGLLGGMSWESTVGYYQSINQGVREKLGGLNSAKIVVYSVNFDSVARLQRKGDWLSTAKMLTDAAKRIEAAGADFLLICTNTMHKVYDDISSNIGIPVLHIADAAARALRKNGITKVGLLGTSFTMEEDFYKKRLQAKHGIEVLIPNDPDRAIIHDVIYSELCRGITKESSKEEYLRIVNNLSREGVEGVILGCTEIGMLISQIDTDIPLFDTAEIHAQMAVEQSLPHIA